MIKMKDKTIHMILCGCLMLSATSCIYDDLSGCGNTHTLIYRMEGNAPAAADIIRDELAATGSEAMTLELERVLLPMFGDRANRLSLAFYRADGTLHTQTEAAPGSNSHTLQVLLPPATHRHIAWAHNAEGYPVELSGADHPDRLRFHHPAATTDTLRAEMAGLFTGRATIPAETSTDTVRLTMQNTAAAIVLVPLSGKPLGEVAMFVRETASGFSCADSLFHFERTPILRGLRTDAGSLTALYSAAFPSRDGAAVDGRAGGQKGLWEVDVYIRVGDKITKNTLHIDRPLRAGLPQVLCFTVNDGGEIAPTQDVTVSVELDWNPGFDFDLDV